MIRVRINTYYHRFGICVEMVLISDVFDFTLANKDMQISSVFSLETLKKCVSDAGFSILEEGSYFIKPFSHRQMEQCLSSGIISDEIINGLSRLEPYMPGLGAEIFVNCYSKA